MNHFTSNAWIAIKNENKIYSYDYNQDIYRKIVESSNLISRTYKIRYENTKEFLLIIQNSLHN